MKTKVIVSCLINDGNSYLFVRQDKPGGAYPNKLHIPGGGMEENETPEQAVRREILEETNLELTNLQPVEFDWDTLVYKGEELQMIFLQFTGEADGTVAQAGSDVTEIVWVERSELAKQTHNQPTIKFLRKLKLIK